LALGKIQVAQLLRKIIRRKKVGPREPEMVTQDDREQSALVAYLLDKMFSAVHGVDFQVASSAPRREYASPEQANPTRA
jgi:hypothetical protein